MRLNNLESIDTSDKVVKIHSPFCAGGDSYLQLHSLVRLMDKDGLVTEVPVASVNRSAAAILFSGDALDFHVTARWEQQSGTSEYIRPSSSCANNEGASDEGSNNGDAYGGGYYNVEMMIDYTGVTAVDVGFQVAFDLIGPGRPRFMIPGAFYKENRFEHNTRKYPRYDFNSGDRTQMVSDHWAFRADRAALPTIFAWNENMSAALCVDEVSEVGLSGIGFSGNREGTSIWVNFPYREEPVVFDGEQAPQPADIQTCTVRPGQKLRLGFNVYISSADLHAYDPFLRTMYSLHRRTHHLNPWMGVSEAAELTAYGLYRWHYHPEHAILYETAAFDREVNNNVKGLGDRPHMHVAWVSGAPYAYALLTYGRSTENPDYVDAATKVLDKIASGIAPNGTFWAEWKVDKGWGCGWNPNREWLQARTISEATLFMLRAISSERTQRVAHHPEWEAAVLSNLRFAVRVQRSDGNFGSYYHCQSGRVEEWDGAGGILWIAALIEGAKLYPGEGFAEAASRAGHYYERFVLDEFIYGAPEDVHLTPTSEDAYNAVVAYVLLYEQDGLGKWLDLARISADWMMTFRWTYNLAFPKHSLLAQYDFRSRGADQASPSNQHLHNYGLFCLPEVLRLLKYTDDQYYLDRTRDLLACFLQFIAREDGDFNAYRGMVTERYYNTHCFQPKGMMVTLSHSWCIGVTLYACQEAAKYEHDLNFED
ncbi:hypothetical protein JZ785_22555 [Alicyclobacillus curvatus]|nr:hypothetical protein JZ785_22555 [Alicyclobacillus curvatus]